ncbi:MAG: autoinducer-2 kinase, partial [Chloroflexota bacterium]
MTATLAIDLGTGSCRAILFDLDGNQLAVGQREWSHAEMPGYPGSQVFDTARNWTLICECIREALDRAGLRADAIAAVSSASMREGIVLYDADGTEIWACPNVDSRAVAEAALLVERGDARRIYDTAGDWVSITSPARLLWITAHQPDVRARVAHVTMLSDWVLARLSGEFVTDPSSGSSSGMFDLAARYWSREIIELCGFPPSVFPQVCEPGTVAGTVTSRAAAETGLRAGTRVVVGGADTQLGLLGIGVAQPGRVTIVGGSFWQTTVVADRPLIDPEARLRTLCHVVPGQWMMEGIGFYSGITMRWYRDAFCELEQHVARERGVDPYVVMEEAAASIPAGSNGVTGIFSNVMDAKRWIHASPSLVGFNVDDAMGSNRRAAIRAIEEAAAYVALGHLRIIEDLVGTKVPDVVFTGGSAKGTLWPRVLADVLGVPVQIPVVKESTALGAAIYAGVGAGLFGDAVSQARRVVRIERTVEPDPATHERYLELHARWATLYARQLDISEAGLLRPLW